MLVRIAFGLAVTAAAISACNTRPSITVVRTSGSEPTVDGDSVKTRRRALDVYQGARGGFWAIRDAEDWKAAWPTGQAPPFPEDMGTSSMLLMAVAESKSATQLKITKVMESTGTVHVWLTQTKAGSGCKPSLDRPPFDAVLTPRIEKPVKVYVTEDEGESCGEPPAATAKCRVGEEETWSSQGLTAHPGDKVTCELSAESRGTFAVSDRVLSIEKVPPGSSAKLAYSRGSARGAFTVDVFGTYALRGEVADEAGRRGSTSLRIDAFPPKTRDVTVQLAWSNFDASDDPDTFPRVVLRAKEAAGRMRECLPDASPADFCQVKKQGAYTQMLLRAGTGNVPLTVDYLDERFEKGPYVCVQLFFDGAKTGELCDDVHRNAQDKWTIGTLNLASGTLVEQATAASGATSPPSSDADASAPKP